MLKISGFYVNYKKPGNKIYRVTFVKVIICTSYVIFKSIGHDEQKILILSTMVKRLSNSVR